MAKVHEPKSVYVGVSANACVLGMWAAIVVDVFRNSFCSLFCCRGCCFYVDVRKRKADARLN